MLAFHMPAEILKGPLATGANTIGNAIFDPGLGRKLTTPPMLIMVPFHDGGIEHVPSSRQFTA